METNASPSRCLKPTEETKTETTMLEELEQPPPEGKCGFLDEDEKPDTDPLGMLSDTELEAIYCRLSKMEQKVYRELLQHYRKQDAPLRQYGADLQELCSTMKEHLPTIPSKDGDQLAEAQRKDFGRRAHERPVQGPWVCHA